MKLYAYLIVSCIIVLPFFVSCSAIRTAVPVKAGFSAENETAEAKKIGDPPKEGWASRYIPGWRAVTGFVPPPSDARQKWDEWNRKRNRSFNSSQELDGL